LASSPSLPGGQLGAQEKASRKPLQLHPQRLIGDGGAAPQSHRQCASGVKAALFFSSGRVSAFSRTRIEPRRRYLISSAWQLMPG